MATLLKYPRQTRFFKKEGRQLGGAQQPEWNAGPARCDRVEMQFIRGWLVVAMILSSPAVGRAEVDIPSIGQPVPFYGAAGKNVRVEANVEPIELGPNDFLTLKLTISRLDNASDVRRPELGELDAFRDFQIDDDANSEPDPPGQRVFRYRLRPRRAAVTAVPGFVFPYFDPTLEQPPDRPDFPFRKARTEPIAIRVRKTERPLQIVPVDVPSFAAVPAVDSAFAIPDWVQWLALAMPPALAIGICVLWQIMNPAGARLARRRRSRAARSALKMLNDLPRRASDDATPVAHVIAAYLAERFDLPGLYITPADLGNRLAELGVDAATAASCEEFMRAVDAARFAPTAIESTAAIIRDAENLVRHLEGEP
ncbi:MAG TPA: hypothetical protein VHR66_02010 [Gemmataceae bacterium]|nr:hypothetical protein [Gemmataceae bacterium]